MPSLEGPIDECATCTETTWYFQHCESDCVLKTTDPFERFQFLTDPTVDEIDHALYLKRIEQGWSHD